MDKCPKCNEQDMIYEDEILFYCWICGYCAPPKSTNETVWILVRIRLVDQEHKKPDIITHVSLSEVPLMEALLNQLTNIQNLVRNEGYAIEEWGVTNG